MSGSKPRLTGHWVHLGVQLRHDIPCSLATEPPLAEHLTSLLKRGVGALLSASTFNHGRVPIYAYSDSLHTNLLKCWTNMTYNTMKPQILEVHVLKACNTLNGKTPP